MKRTRFFFANERGNVAVMLALSLTVLLGVTAMVIDVGRLYHEKRILQNAMDAAALSGAQGLLTSEVSAASIAKELASKNTFPVDDGDLTITSQSIKVSKQSIVPMTFARVFGIQEASVKASAKAEVGLLKSAKRVTPIAIEHTAIPNETELKCENTGKHHGNCGYLDINSNGASGLAENIINGVELEVGTNVQTEPGQKWGPVKNAIETLISQDAGKTKCQAAATADFSCARIVIIPLIDSWDGVNGKSTVKVVGLAAYWIDRLDEPKRIVGKFKKVVTTGEIGGSGPGNLYGVKLVE
ncbi:TadE/TadG family type IV pilus assembly protein [Guptibacillus hwajinpoensis]|uniref:TadE/TadG family type IV pilus assembly protein n=1 Tax=Guptibacillus hwajinpoensis TaxID=208199 RepID=UPI0024B369EC|nr:TadE/TadG family type IV pilus assembly protein [Pseudalkalibacillus hwajinpoensis]